MEHDTPETPQRAHLSKKSLRRPAGVVVVAVVIAGISFFGGVSYQKHHGGAAKTSAMTASMQRTMGGYGGGGGFRRAGSSRIIGQVTAVNATSITVTANDGSSKTLSITSDTVISNNGQAATASDIQTGDTVFITVSASDASQAARILLNPNFGSGMGGTSPSQNTTPTQTN